MQRISRKFLPAANLTVACLATLLPGDIRGDAINPWQGASVSVLSGRKGRLKLRRDRLGELVR